MKSIKNGDYTLEEIAKILGITRERVRQIEAQALKKLKSPKIGKKLREYVSGES
ncbi:sigma factor-like helix-turn-helix DNA-binding protein [Sulfurimonas hydrogeniphila]|uniref:sigma factor-like helix-turn-helix DNA-binding protein n=1 Tax=Sulfurimonas hydrogeniphila TaxID=2509341 RepID=UPI00125F8C35